MDIFTKQFKHWMMVLKHLFSEHPWIELSFDTGTQSNMTNQFTTISEAYERYYNDYMMTTADPMSKTEFITRVVNDKYFAEIWGINKIIDSRETFEQKKED